MSCGPCGFNLWLGILEGWVCKVIDTPWQSKKELDDWEDWRLLSIRRPLLYSGMAKTGYYGSEVDSLCTCSGNRVVRLQYCRNAPSPYHLSVDDSCYHNSWGMVPNLQRMPRNGRVSNQRTYETVGRLSSEREVQLVEMVVIECDGNHGGWLGETLLHKHPFLLKKVTHATVNDVPADNVSITLNIPHISLWSTNREYHYQ